VSQDQERDFLVKNKARLYSDDHWTGYPYISAMVII